MIRGGSHLSSRGRPCVSSCYSDNRCWSSFEVEEVDASIYWSLSDFGEDREVAYRVALPPSLANLHDVFHVSQLRRYIHDPSHVVQLDDPGLFGKERSKGTTFKLNTFSFEAWIMMNFEVEVWEIKHI